MKYKSDAPSVFANFLQYVKNQFGCNVLCVRSDNALELVSGKMKDLFLKEGIVSQLTCAYSPQQNGVVERKHRHLLETARSLYIQSNVPARFWGECVLCATYLINRMPLKSIDFHSPYSKIYNDQPSLQHLKSFGCLCYVSTSKVQRSKFDHRAFPAVFLGYPVSTKGYKVLNLLNNEITVSRDVSFYETHFPFHIFKSQSTSLYQTSIFLPKTTHSSIFDDISVHQNSTSGSTPVHSNSSNTSSDSIPFSPPSSTLSGSTPVNSSSSGSAHDYSTTDSSHSVDLSNLTPLVRQSIRQRNPPSYLQDYHCLAGKSVSNHWCNLVAAHQMPSDFHSFIDKNSVITEPSSYLEASASPLWVEAMQKEVTA